MLNNISAREKKAILLAIIVITIGVVYKYFAVPYMDSWKTVTTQIDQTNARLVRAKQLKANPNAALYSENTIRNQTATIALLLENLEAWSNDAGLKITSIKPGTVVDKQTSRELSFDIEVNGDLSAVCKLVDSIEQPGTIAKINKVRISKPKDLLRDLTAVITVSTLCLPETAQIKKTSPTKDSNENY